MARIRRVVLDLLKPHEPTALQFAQRVAETEGVDGVNAMLVESDREVDTLKLTIEGDSVDFAAVENTIDGLGGSIHSVDEVACGDRLVEESHTSQD